MFATPQEAIAFSLRSSKVMLHRFVDDFKPEEFQHRACLGSNNAAWILGHLTSVDRTLLERMGVSDLPPLPEGFKERFATTRAAATGTPADFGPPEQLVRYFDQHRDLLIANVHRIPAKELDAPPHTSSPMFSDRGESLLFLGLHTAMHMGQLTIIRRSLGRPPLS